MLRLTLPSFRGKKVRGTIDICVLSNGRNKKRKEKNIFFKVLFKDIIEKKFFRFDLLRITKKISFSFFLLFDSSYNIRASILFLYIKNTYIPISIRDVFLIIHDGTWHERGNLGAVSGFQLFRLMIRRKGVVSRNGISKARHVPGTGEEVKLFRPSFVPKRKPRYANKVSPLR